MTPARSLAGLIAATVVAAGLTAVSVAGASGAAAAPVTVTDAALRWGVNNETNNAAFAPGTWNLMSAGRIGNPTAGAQTLRTADEGTTWSNGKVAGWTNHVGTVSVEDEQADHTYAPATFEGTRRDDAGTLSTTGANAVHAGTRLVFDDGTGTVDPAANTASISWHGDATVLYYSGMTFFYVSDPELTVDSDGTGTVTATLSGFGASMADPQAWTTIAPKRVALATLAGVQVTASGFTTTPAYRGVAYTAPANGTPQTRTGADWGSFPQSFVDFQQLTGQASYWYSSGGAADTRKPTLPVTVQVDAADPLPATVTTAKASYTGRYGAATPIGVTVAGAGGTPSNRVSLVEGATTLARARLTNGQTTVSVPASVVPGTHQLVVRYEGDGRYDSTTRAVTVQIAAGTLTAPTPTVSGSFRVGSTLTAQPGAWTAGTTLSYQWRRAGVAIAKATARTYRAVAADAGRTLSVLVTGRKTYYTTASRASASRTVAAGTLGAARVRVTGTARVGRTLTAAGTWTPAPVSLRYQWRAAGKVLRGATKRTLKLGGTLRGKRVTVSVTGVKPGYRSTARQSSATAKVAR